jgi:hypothetical protein
VHIFAPLKGEKCMEEEIMSTQVIFPDGRTLDEIIEEIKNKLSETIKEE